MNNQIGALHEGPLHAALKAWYSRSGDQVEAPVGGYVVDIVRGTQLIEIQTGSFGALKAKVQTLTPDYALTLVYPVAQEKWLVKRNAEGREFGKRKSPKRGGVLDMFYELVRLPGFLATPHCALEVVLIREEEVREHHPQRAWRRRGWMTVERRLLDVLAVQRFSGVADLVALLPQTLSMPFTTADLAETLGCPRPLAAKMAYCLRALGGIAQTGKRGRAYLYQLVTLDD